VGSNFIIKQLGV